MPWFHATHVERIPSILKHGLCGGMAKNWPGTEDGVYLAVHPAIAVDVMLERYFRFGPADSMPRDELARWRVIVIDDARIRPNLLRPDPEVPDAPEGAVMLYGGIIDVAGMPILTIDDLVQGQDPVAPERADP